MDGPVRCRDCLFGSVFLCLSGFVRSNAFLGSICFGYRLFEAMILVITDKTLNKFEKGLKWLKYIITGLLTLAISLLPILIMSYYQYIEYC